MDKKEWKIYLKKYLKQWRKEHPQYQKEWYQKHKEEHNNYVKKYNQTSKGKEVYTKHQAKRKRNFGFNIIYPNIIDEQYDYHHINNDDVVALTKDLHQLYLGKSHRENMKYIIKQIYKEV
jgi:hypothetical protein